MKRLIVFLLCLLFPLAAVADEPTAVQLAEFRELVGSGAITSAEFETFLAQNRPAPSVYVTDTFRVKVTCDLKTAIAAGMYGWREDSEVPLTKRNILSTECRAGVVNVTLLHFGKWVYDAEILTEIEKAGFRPANLWELLALGVTQPGVQRNREIVALGSMYVGKTPDWSFTHSLELSEVWGQRALVVSTFPSPCEGDPNSAWPPYFYFLAVRNK